jgi:hypothetical protein
MFGGFFIARVITAYVNEHKKIFALCFGTGSGDAHPHEETAFTIAHIYAMVAPSSPS